MIGRSADMNPADRAEFFTLVDRLEAETINDNVAVEASKIPQSLYEIFEISNANRRLNKCRKK